MGLFFSRQPSLAPELRRVSRVSATSPHYPSNYLLSPIYEVGLRLLTLLNPSVWGQANQETLKAESRLGVFPEPSR